MNDTTTRGYLNPYQHELSVEYLQKALKELAKVQRDPRIATTFFYLAHENLAEELGAVVQEVFKSEGLFACRWVSDEDAAQADECAHGANSARHEGAWYEAEKAAAQIFGEAAVAAAFGAEQKDKDDPIPF